MPNWCSNDVVFKGEAEKIKQLEAFCRGMDFNKIAPMPETLGIRRGTMSFIAEKIFAGEELEEHERYHLDRLPLDGEKTKEKPYGESSGDISYHWKGTGTEGNLAWDTETDPRSQGDLYEMGRLISENKRRYGAGDWLDWRYDNWGVKWEAFDIYSGNYGEALEYGFRTAGNPPVDIMIRIIKYLRELSGIGMRWSYAKGTNISGEYVLTEDGVRETVYCDYDDYMYPDKPMITGISIHLNVDSGEFAVLPDGWEDESGLCKTFSSGEELYAYIEGLALVNGGFKSRLLRYVSEYDTGCEYISHWGDEGITDVEPVDYYFSISTVRKYEYKEKGKDEKTEEIKRQLNIKPSCSFEELLNDPDKWRTRPD